MYGGLTVGAGVLAWHSARRGNWLLLADNFDALVWLGLLLAAFVMYTQGTRPLRGLDWFVLPIVVLLLVLAAVFGRTNPHEYDARSVWLWTHRVTAYGAPSASPWRRRWGRCTSSSITASAPRPRPPPAGRRIREPGAIGTPDARVGHARLLSIDCRGRHRRPADIGRRKTHPAGKDRSGAAVWLVYALVLHSPINPSFRAAGRPS